MGTAPPGEPTSLWPGWFLTPFHHVGAGDLKAAFREVRERFRAGLTEDDVQHWHHVQDAPTARRASSSQPPKSKKMAHHHKSRLNGLAMAERGARPAIAASQRLH
jgi:hypothetical protein